MPKYVLTNKTVKLIKMMQKNCSKKIKNCSHILKKPDMSILHKNFKLLGKGSERMMTEKDWSFFIKTKIPLINKQTRLGKKNFPQDCSFPYSHSFHLLSFPFSVAPLENRSFFSRERPKKRKGLQFLEFSNSIQLWTANLAQFSENPFFDDYIENKK